MGAMTADNKNYKLDKTSTYKIGKSTFIVSSFLRTDGSPTFLETLQRLINQELAA